MSEKQIEFAEQAGFKKDFRTVDNIFILRTNNKGHDSKRKLASCIVILLKSRKLLILYLVLCCGRCWQNLVSGVGS